MRALLDTNLLIAYLLAPDRQGTVQSVVEAAFEGKYTFLLPVEVIRELKEKLATKKYLIKYISGKTAEKFIPSLSVIASQIPAITEPIPLIGRDLKDDFLLAYAVVGEADYLVSGDHDLTVLKEVGKVKIISPATFLSILKKEK